MLSLFPRQHNKIMFFSLWSRQQWKSQAKWKRLQFVSSILAIL